MAKIEIGNISSSNFAIGDNNEIHGQVVINDDLKLNDEDIEMIKEELEYVKRDLRSGTKVYTAVDEVIKATDRDSKNVIQTIKKYAGVFTSNMIINLISSGVYDLIKCILNS